MLERGWQIAGRYRRPFHEVTHSRAEIIFEENLIYFCLNIASITSTHGPWLHNDSNIRTGQNVPGFDHAGDLEIASNFFETVFEQAGLCRVTLVDLLISVGSAGLAVFSLPTVLNKDSQVPRRTASIPTAAILTYFVPLFAISGLVLTSITIAGQALVWWLIVAFRPVNKHE